jgi:hypothetical protein
MRANSKLTDAPASGQGEGRSYALNLPSDQFLCSIRGPFLRPDLRERNDAARRRRQGWPSRRACRKLCFARPRLDGGEHGVMLPVGGTKR